MFTHLCNCFLVLSRPPGTFVHVDQTKTNNQRYAVLLFPNLCISIIYTDIYIYICVYVHVIISYIYIYTCINTMLIVFYSSYWCCFYVRLYRYNYAILACTDEDAVCTCGRNIPWFCNLVVVTQLLAWSIWAAGVCDDRSRPPTESKQNSHNNYGLW